MFCTNCGSPLSAGTPAPSGAPPMYPAPGAYGGAMPGLPSAWDVGRRKQIDRTKTGLLLLLIGGLILWISIFWVFGGGVLLARALLLVLRGEGVGPAPPPDGVPGGAVFFFGEFLLVFACG